MIGEENGQDDEEQWTLHEKENVCSQRGGLSPGVPQHAENYKSLKRQEMGIQEEEPKAHALVGLIR